MRDHLLAARKEVESAIALAREEKDPNRRNDLMLELGTVYDRINYALAKLKP